MSGHYVCLSESEMFAGALAGVHRQIEAVKNRQKPSYGIPGGSPDWQIHIEGALAECALAKHLGAYWSGKGILGGPDIGSGIQCRSTSRPDGRLILHDKDDPNERFFLVRGSYGKYEIAGWVWGFEGQDERFRYNGERPCYMVPDRDLRQELLP